MSKIDSSREIYGIGQDLISMALRDDSLVRQYGELLCNDSRELAKLRGKAHASGIKRRLEKKARLNKQICRKYCIPGWTSTGFPTHDTLEEWLLSIKALNRSAPLTWGTNWGPFFSTYASLTYIPRHGTRWKRTDKEANKAPATPISGLPTLTIKIDLSQANGRDIDRLAGDFKLVLKCCLEDVPSDLRKPPSPWSQNNERDYRRFQQHMEQGVPFRVIAAYEKFGRMPSKRLGMPIKAESSVRESVDRVHRIIFQQPYRARLHSRQLSDSRLDQTVKTFNCPNHGRDCFDLSCSYAKAFVEEYLP